MPLADRELFEGISRALAQSEIERALEATLVVLSEALDLDAAWIWLLEEGSGKFYLGAGYDLPPYLREPLHMTGDPCWCIQEFEDGELESENVDVMTCSRLREGSESEGPGVTRGLRAHASVALGFAEHRLGILNAARARTPRFEPAELRLLATVSTQIGIAIDRARLAERAAAAARSEERGRIAREIHDTLAQDLTAVTLQLESAQRRLPGGDEVARERIETALDLSRRSLAQLRSSVEGLRSDPLGGMPLAAALASLARRFTSETGVRVAFRSAPADIELPGGIEHELYRIAAEALANVGRHAKARHVELRIDCGQGDVRLRVSDDGIGFRRSEAASGFGLHVMAERAQAAGGRLSIESQPDGGTTIEAVVPVPVE